MTDDASSHGGDVTRKRPLLPFRSSRRRPQSAKNQCPRDLKLPNGEPSVQSTRSHCRHPPLEGGIESRLVVQKDAYANFAIAACQFA